MKLSTLLLDEMDMQSSHQTPIKVSKNLGG